MKQRFLNNVYSAFNNVIYTRFGEMAVVKGENDEKSLVRLVAFNLPSALINIMESQERMKHILVDLHYKYDGVDFMDTYETSKRTHEIVTNMEMLIYNAEEGTVIRNEVPTME